MRAVVPTGECRDRFNCRPAGMNTRLGKHNAMIHDEIGGTMEQAVTVRKKVLAVDDSTSLREMVAFTLRGAGFDVIEAENGQEALEISKREAFDVVLTDQNMPRMDGLTLVRSLRALPGYRKVPILMLTTESGDEMKQQGRAAGATGWIVKPFNPDRLIEVIRKVTG